MKNFDDVGDAIREDRPLREAANYRIRFGLEGLTFRHIDVPDPVPTGRQILESAGLDRRNDYLLFALLPSGDFEDIRLDETVDLRGHPNAPPETNVKFSMTYRNAASLPHAGELGEGGSVEVKKRGSIFNVTRTVQS